jgi:hypothetical protein
MSMHTSFGLSAKVTKLKGCAWLFKHQSPDQIPQSTDFSQFTIEAYRLRLAAYSQSEQGFATHFNMYPEVQLPSPNGSLGHTRGQVNCAMARSKALINAVMPV